MRKIIFFTILTVLFAGCSSDDVDNSVRELPVSAATLPGVITRAGTTVTSGSIGVFLGTANGYPAKNNIQYTYSGGIWTSETPLFVGSNMANLCACYPYDATMTGSAVTLTSQLYSAAKDISYAPTITANNTTPGVTFNMRRAYAQITFTIIHQTTYTDNCVISGVSIANAGILSSASLDMTSATYSLATAGTVSFNPNITPAYGGSSTCSVLMVPVSTPMTGNITFTFTIDGLAQTATLPVESSNMATLDSGLNYNVELKVGSIAVVTPATVTTTNWNEQTAVSGGDIK